jgi:tol-pal system protein YbgF
VTTTLGEFQDEGRALRESIDELRRSVERRSPQVVYRPSVAPDTASANAVDDEFVDTPPDIDPSQLYENAFLDVRKGNYELAIDQFRDILIYFGDTEYAPNARYWIGECWYSLAGTTTANEDENEDLNFYDSAVVEFEYLVANHPESDRVPTALYKLGRCYEELGRTRRARRYYERVRDEFPKSLEAKPAEGRLENLE